MGSRFSPINQWDDPPWDITPDATVNSPVRVGYAVAVVGSFGVLLSGLVTPWYGIGQAGESWPHLNPQLSPSSPWLHGPGWRDFLPGYAGLAIVVLVTAGIVGIAMALLASAKDSNHFGWMVLPAACVASVVSISIVADAFARPTNTETQPAQTSWGVYLALLLSLIATAAAWRAARGRSISMGQVSAMKR